MNRKHLRVRPLAFAGALALLGGASAAQGEAPRIDEIVRLALADAAQAADTAFDFDDASFAFAFDEMGSERVVKGAPYCADAVHETVQTLTDGNRIVRKQQTRLCRDGEGRTRQEVDRDGRKLVWLRDPVAHQGWLLDPQRKTARRLGHFGHAAWFNDAEIGAAHAEEWRALADQARAQAREAADQARQQVREQMREQAGKMRDAARAQAQAAREQARVASAAAAAVAAAAPQPVVITRTSPMEMQVLRVNEVPPTPPVPPVPPAALTLPPPPPVVRWQALHVAPRGAGATASLGSKDVEGVRANGERTTWTIEAGRIGNEKPILITREVWTSPDLLLTVLSRDADPRSGETVYRLANLKRGEPDAGLMKVPADYTVRGDDDRPRGGRPAEPAPRPRPGASGPKG